MFDLCREKSTSKSLLQFSPRIRSFPCSWLQDAVLVSGNSFAANSACTSCFRNLLIIAKTSNTLSECNVWINGSSFWHNTKNRLKISTTVQSEFRPKYLYIWFDHWFFGIFNNEYSQKQRGYLWVFSCSRHFVYLKNLTKGYIHEIKYQEN